MKKDEFEPIFKGMLERDMFEYGGVIEKERFFELFDLEELSDEKAANMSVKEIIYEGGKIELKALEFQVMISERLILMGKYFGKMHHNYYTHLPSENNKICTNLLNKAIKRIEKAGNLLRSTPVQYKEKSNTASRALMAREKIVEYISELD